MDSTSNLIRDGQEHLLLQKFLKNIILSETKPKLKN